MYGLVNQAIKDMVITKFGDEIWIAVCSEAKLEATEFSAMEYYPDTITYSLVGAVSHLLKIPAPTVLSEFGKYWVLYTSKEGYGPILDLFGTDFRSSLMNLNNLHTRMGMTMPQLTPPRFTFAEIANNVYEVGYISQRQGLSPMMFGLLEGLAARHNVQVKIEFFENQHGEGSKVFKVTVQE